LYFKKILLSINQLLWLTIIFAIFSKVHQPPDRKIVLTAQTDIEEGEEITTKYLPALMGSARRRFKVFKKCSYFFIRLKEF